MVLPLLTALLMALDPSHQQQPREMVMTFEGGKTDTLKRYVMCIYTRGTGKVAEEDLERLQKEHLAHQGRLADEGVLIVAGPFGGNGEKRGILIFDVGSVEEAEPYVKADPMVKVGRLAYELLPWWTAKGTVIK